MADLDGDFLPFNLGVCVSTTSMPLLKQLIDVFK
jgi:hypothetical protein